MARKGERIIGIQKVCARDGKLWRVKKNGGRKKRGSEW